MSVVPKVSVVLPTYQRAHLLRSTLPTLLSQSLADIELVVMDDGSTDETADVVGAFRDPRLRYFKREHLGIPRIINEGITLSRGGYIMLCHDHDAYDRDLLAELAACLDRHPTAAFAHCGLTVADPSGAGEVARFVRDYPGLTPGKEFLVRELLPTLASRVAALSMIRRSACGERFFDARFGPCADVELWLRLSTGGDVGYVKKPLITVRARDAGDPFAQLEIELGTTVLEAKKLYLPFVEDEGTRKCIRRGWRREVDQLALAVFWNALRRRRRDQLARVLRLAREEGTGLGYCSLALLSRLPFRVSFGVLATARGLRRVARPLAARATGA